MPYLLLLILVVVPFNPTLRTCTPSAARLALLLALLLLPLGSSLEPLLLLLRGPLPLALLEFGNLIGLLGVQINLLEAEQLPPAAEAASHSRFLREAVIRRPGSFGRSVGADRLNGDGKRGASRRWGRARHWFDLDAVPSRVTILVKVARARSRRRPHGILPDGGDG